MLETILRSGFAEMGITADAGAVARFHAYYDFLTEKNSVMDLTAIRGEADTARLHFLDSLSPLLFFGMDGCRVIDVGAGAGFPGLPLKIACPGMELTLLDSLNKRVEFLKEACERMGLQAECVHSRAEECGDRREKYDYAVSRAVARLHVLCELCLPYVKVGGAFLALKGPAADSETQEAGNAIRTLGGELEKVLCYNIPGTGLDHKLVVIRKIAPTPEKYPRRFSAIKKLPL